MNEQALQDLILQLKMQLRDAAFEHFARYELFSAVWWMLLGLAVVPLIIWWKLVDKKRLFEISMFGLLLGLTATFLDVIGTDYGLWVYRVHMLPETAVLVPVDFVVLPVIQMYVYQRCPKWGKYLLFSLLSAAVQSFAAEPLAVLIGQYKLVRWNILYSFPIYLAMDVIIKWIAGRFKKAQEKAVSGGGN